MNKCHKHTLSEVEGKVKCEHDLKIIILLYKIECFIVSGVAPSAMNVSIAQNVSDIFNFTIAGKCLIVLKHLINSCVLDIEAHNST